MNDNYEDDQFSDILTDMCGAIVKTIGLIPPEHREARLLACAYVLDHVNDAVERMVNGGNATERLVNEDSHSIVPWSTPTLTEVTDPEEARLIRLQCVRCNSEAEH